VIHRYDDRFLRIPVHDPFQANFLSSHGVTTTPPPDFTFQANQRDYFNTSNKTGNKMQMQKSQRS
jgi:hypothetical protein